MGARAVAVTRFGPNPSYLQRLVEGERTVTENSRLEGPAGDFAVREQTRYEAFERFRVDRMKVPCDFARRLICTALLCVRFPPYSQERSLGKIGMATRSWV